MKYLLEEAKAYRTRVVKAAEGETGRFLDILAEYERAPQITRDRLYIETLEAILPGMEKVIIEDGASENLLPYIPLGRKGVQR